MRKIAAVTWRSWWLLPRTLFLIAWLLVRERSTHRRATAMLQRAVKTPRLGDDPLREREHEPGLYEVAPWFLHETSTHAEHSTRAAQCHPEPAPDALTVVHLLGTGENVYSPLVGLAGMCLAEPRLRSLRHVIVDTSYDAGSYLGPNEFGTRTKRTLAPLFARHRERLVLVGLSRGGTAALNFGTELADEHGTRVGVLALAPPFARPFGRPPLSALNIGGFEPIVVNFSTQLSLLPPMRPFGTWLVRDLYIRFSAFVLAELRMVSEASIAMFARHIAALDPVDVCMRSVREFALLGRVSDAELRLVVSGVTQRLARTANAHAIVCWGQDDTWVEVEPCHALLRSLLERDRVPRECIHVVKLPGLSHGIGREPDQDFAPVAALLWEACEHAENTA